MAAQAAEAATRACADKLKVLVTTQNACSLLCKYPGCPSSIWEDAGNQTVWRQKAAIELEKVTGFINPNQLSLHCFKDHVDHADFNKEELWESVVSKASNVDNGFMAPVHLENAEGAPIHFLTWCKDFIFTEGELLPLGKAHPYQSGRVRSLICIHLTYIYAYINAL